MRFLIEFLNMAVAWEKFFVDAFKYIGDRFMKHLFFTCFFLNVGLYRDYCYLILS